MEIEDLMVNATHMWRANGSPENKDPSEYLRLEQTIEFISDRTRRVCPAPTFLASASACQP
jgi:hypothetical protein